MLSIFFSFMCLWGGHVCLGACAQDAYVKIYGVHFDLFESVLAYHLLRKYCPESIMITNDFTPMFLCRGASCRECQHRAH